MSTPPETALEFSASPPVRISPRAYVRLLQSNRNFRRLWLAQMVSEIGDWFYTVTKDPSQIPAVAEPWFLAFNASVEIHPVMTPADLAKAGPAIEQAVKKYG